MKVESDLRSWLREDFDLEVVSLERVRGGADENAALWRGQDGDGASYAVKWSSGGSSAGLAVSAHLAGLGVEGVAAPRRTTDGDLWSVRTERRLSLVPWISNVCPPDWTAFGALLARVHAAPISDELRAVLPLETHAHDRAAQALRLLEAARASGNELLDRARAAGRRLLERADALAPRLRARPFAPVICHGDPHLLNLLADGERLWLIDWDDARLAPRELDLMFLLAGGVLAFAPVTPEQQAAFFAGYGPVELDPERLAYYRAVRALEDLAFPAVRVLDAERWSEPEREEAAKNLRGVLSPTGLVRAAL